MTSHIQSPPTGYCEILVKYRGGRDWAAIAVVGQFLIVDFAHGGVFLCLSDDAGLANIDAEIVAELSFDYLQ